MDIKTSKNINYPYKQLTDLPENVRSVLPKHAQEIYQAAYNNAWDEYKKAEDRRRVLGHGRLELICTSIAFIKLITLKHKSL